MTLLLDSINSVMSQQGSNACLTSGSSAPEMEDKTDAIIETNDLILEQVVGRITWTKKIKIMLTFCRSQNKMFTDLH